MTTPKIQQAQQIRDSLVYDDTIIPSEATFETNPGNLRADLDALRSAVNHLMTGSLGNWFDQLVTTAGTQRGVNSIAQAVEVLEFGRNIFTDFRSKTPIYVRNTGNNANDGSTELLAVQSIQRAHELFRFDEGGWNAQYLDLTGFSETLTPPGPEGDYFSLPRSHRGAPNDFSATSFTDGRQDYLGYPIGYYADPLSVRAITISGYIVDPDTGQSLFASVNETLVVNAHAGQFISVGPGEFARIHSNTTSELKIATNFIATTGATFIYRESCELTFTTAFGMTLTHGGPVSFNGIKFSGGILRNYIREFCFFQLCSFEGFYTDGIGIASAYGCYFDNDRMQLEGAAIELVSCVAQGMNIRSHGSGGNGRNTLSYSILDGCTAYGAGNFESSFDVEAENSLIENGTGDGIHKQSSQQCRISNVKIQNCAGHGIRADVGGGLCRVDTVSGTGNGGYGLLLANGCHANAIGAVTVAGALGEVKVGSAQASLWGEPERTDGNSLVPEFCRILPGETPGLENGNLPEVALLVDLPVKGTQAYIDAASPVVVLATGTEYRKSAIAGQNWTALSGIGIPWSEDVFTATLGQITFVLTTAPSDLNSVELEINGVGYDVTTDYTLSGTNITWLNTDFALEAGEVLKVRYQ